jgi:hypothetical protein
MSRRCGESHLHLHHSAALVRQTGPLEKKGCTVYGASISEAPPALPNVSRAPLRFRTSLRRKKVYLTPAVTGLSRYHRLYFYSTVPAPAASCLLFVPSLYTFQLGPSCAAAVIQHASHNRRLGTKQGAPCSAVRRHGLLQPAQQQFHRTRRDRRCNIRGNPLGAHQCRAQSRQHFDRYQRKGSQLLGQVPRERRQ